MTLNNKEPNIDSLASTVELIFFDFDGVFTDNSVYVSQDGVETVLCSRSDGLGLRRLDDVDVDYYIVSTESNPVVTTRANKLNIPVTQGHSDKLKIIKEIALEKKIDLSSVAYVGNDINDLECLKSVGFPIVVPDAFLEVIPYAKYRTKKLGGYGAVREICDIIYKAKQRVATHLPVPRFPASESVGPRDWGEENLLVLSSGNYTMKKLSTKAGKKGGLQYHRMKDEASYIISGEMILRYDDGSGKIIEKKVGPGDWFHFPAGCVHQEEAVSDVERIEVSTPYFNDRVRVEEDYGIQDLTGLPTTKELDILFK